MRLDLLSKVAHRPKIVPLSFPATWRITKTTEKKSSAELRRAKPQDAASHRGKKSGEKRKLHNNPSLPHPDPHPYPPKRKKNERRRKYHFKTFCGSNLVSGKVVQQAQHTPYISADGQSTHPLRDPVL